VVVSNVAGVVTSAVALVTVIDPVITAQPVSRTNHAGSAAVFSVQAQGTAPEYQWYKNGGPVSGGTRAELVLAGVTDVDEGEYRRGGEQRLREREQHGGHPDGLDRR